MPSSNKVRLLTTSTAMAVALAKLAKADMLPSVEEVSHIENAKRIDDEWFRSILGDMNVLEQREEGFGERKFVSTRSSKRNNNSTYVRSGRKPSRNDPCPCGSGKKYKKCHMNLIRR